MDEFCTDLLSFAMDHNYRPEVEWKRYKTRLSSFDVRHMVWSIATRLGLGKGRVYCNDDCTCYIERRFASLCVTASGEPLSHNTLRNLTVTSYSDQIHCDYPGKTDCCFIFLHNWVAHVDFCNESNRLDAISGFRNRIRLSSRDRYPRILTLPYQMVILSIMAT